MPQVYKEEYAAKAVQLIDEHLAAIADPLGLNYTPQIEETAWLQFALNPFPELFQPGYDKVKAKIKDALLRRPFSESQIATIYKYLTNSDPVGGGLGMATYGGRVNATGTITRDCSGSKKKNHPKVVQLILSILRFRADYLRLRLR